MIAPRPPSPSCLSWLKMATVGVMCFGLALLLSPGLARQGFSLLVYADTGHLSAFDEAAVRCVSLAHAVLGVVMLALPLGASYRVFHEKRP